MNFMEAQIGLANQQAIERIETSKVVLAGISEAGKKIPFLKGYSILHSGPPVKWENMCSAMKNAICGAIVYEGWADNIKDAFLLADSGEIRFGSNNEHSAVGPMAGIISPSMPVFIFKNETFGNQAFVTINEGLGKTLRFGANDDDVIKKLKWLEETFAPILKEAIELGGPINITSLLARGVQRGDECHNRNKASTNLFISEIAPWVSQTSASKKDISQAFDFMNSNEHFFLNLSMGNSKATMDTIIGIQHSTIVSCMSTNGYEFGIRVSGAGEKWFTSGSPYAIGSYFEGYSDTDASTVMGDSYISEACGIGGFAMAAAPGIGRFIGITTQETQDYSIEMYDITIAEHKLFKIPVFGFRGVPLGIDIRKVLSFNKLPVINTGIAHKEPGVGQIGAGVVFAPMKCFEQALSYLKQEYKQKS